MATFSQWLAGHEAGPQDDPVAWMARTWKRLEGSRPRVSSPSGIEKHLVKQSVAAELAPGYDHGLWVQSVNQAVAEATKRYRRDKAAEQLAAGDEPPAQVAAQPPPAADGINPATGKPVAILSAKDWTEHPLATKFGSCQQEGWALGVAVIDGRKVLTCAAGHIVNTGTPAVFDAAAGAAEQGLQVAPGAHDEVVTDAGQLAAVEAGQMSPASHLAANEVAAAAASVAESDFAPLAGQAQPLTQLDRIELRLTALCAAMGLPSEMGDLAVFIAAASGLGEQAAAETGEQSLSSQLAGTIPAADFAAWYSAADPAAGE